MHLVKWQQQFLQYVQAPTENGLSSVFADDGLYSRDRMQAYRNNYTGGLLSFLKLAYPQIRSLLGEQYFSFLAQEYIANTPLNNNNYAFYGATFLAYLTQAIQEKKTLENLPYLVDVAAIDWAMYLAYFAESRSTFDFKGYAQLPSEQQLVARFFLSKDVVLVQSHWPLLALWRFYRDSHPLKQVVRHSVNRFYVVHRPEYASTIVQVTWQQWQLLMAVQKGRSVEQLASIDSDAIPELISQGWVCRWEM
jgi:hypothetical protein